MQIRWLNILRLTLLGALLIPITLHWEKVQRVFDMCGDVLAGRPGDYRLIDLLVLGLLVAGFAAIVRLVVARTGGS